MASPTSGSRAETRVERPCSARTSRGGAPAHRRPDRPKRQVDARGQRGADRTSVCGEGSAHADNDLRRTASSAELLDHVQRRRPDRRTSCRRAQGRHVLAARRIRPTARCSGRVELLRRTAYYVPNNRATYTLRTTCWQARRPKTSSTARTQNSLVAPRAGCDPNHPGYVQRSTANWSRTAQERPYSARTSSASSWDVPQVVSRRPSDHSTGSTAARSSTT